jgi:hypothetical protein
MDTAVPLPETSFHESKLWATPIRDLGLKIEGTPLEPVIAEFRRELEATGFHKLRPHFYLTTDWVVHDDTIAIGIPFSFFFQPLRASRQNTSPPQVGRWWPFH